MKDTQSNRAGKEAVNGHYFRRKEIADRLGVTERTIDLWREKRGLPHYKPGGRVYFIGAEVDAWFRTRRVTKTESGPRAAASRRRPAGGPG